MESGDATFGGRPIDGAEMRRKISLTDDFPQA